MLQEELKKIAGKYNFPSRSDNDVAQLCFAFVLDTLLKKAKKRQPQLFERLSEKEKLTVVDVGCGYFRYGKALNAILSEVNQNVRILAVDKEKYCSNYSPAEFIKAEITSITPELKKIGIRNIDVFTVLNPFPAIPDLNKLPLQLRKKSVLIGCVDWNKKLFEKSLEKNKFRAVAWQKNKWQHLMKSWFNNYNPFVFAVSSHLFRGFYGKQS